MIQTHRRAMLLAMLLLSSLVLLATCRNQSSATGVALDIPDLIPQAQKFTGQEITVKGAYLWRPGNPDTSVLAIGLSTRDNGLDAQPLGESIWIDSFPKDVKADLHQPGDAIYGVVEVTGRFETGGGFGPDGAYQYRLDVAQATPIEQITWIEHRLETQALGEGKVSFLDLQRNAQDYNGQTVTTQAYYLWNPAIYVLAEGIRTDEISGNPQPLGATIWVENFPPDQSAALTLGPNNSFVWGLVEVTGTFQTGGGFGKDGAYQSILLIESASAIGNQ
jgi:hypothetical protein